MKHARLGRGMKFPPQVNAVTGRFVTSENEQNIKESIYLILMTRKGERMMRPAFGSRTSDYVFSETNLTMLHIMAHELERDITRGEPRVHHVEIEMDYDSSPGCLFIHIRYTVNGAGTPEDMVVPFYTDGAAQEEGTDYETVEDDPIE